MESATDSNVFTDADHTKLNGIAANATNTSAPHYTSAITSSDVTTALGYTPIAPDADAQLNTLHIDSASGPSLAQGNNTDNLKVQGGSGNTVGITGYGGDGGWDFQIYGSGGTQGFLTSNWGSWGWYVDTSGNLSLIHI